MTKVNNSNIILISSNLKFKLLQIWRKFNMKKSKEFLKKLAAITLCSIAALQNISANTVINFDQGTVSFDTENPQKATVVSGGATREVPGIQDGNCYLYPWDEYNFICCNPKLNTYDVLSTASSTSTWIYDFGGGITFWRGNWTGYCYFIDNGTIIVPVSVSTGNESCQFQYHKSNGVSYTIRRYGEGVFFYPEITSPYSQQININYPPAQGNNLNDFNYNQPQVINSNASQYLFHQTQMPVTPFRNTLNVKSSETTNISPTKKPTTPSLSTLEMQKAPNMEESGSREGRTERIGVYDFPAGIRNITDFDDFKTVRPTNCCNHHRIQDTYAKNQQREHSVVYQDNCARRTIFVAYQDLSGILGWKLARAAVLAGYKVPPSQRSREGWDIYANPTAGSKLEEELIKHELWDEEMRLDALPKKDLTYADGGEFTEIDKKIFCEIREKGIPPEWKKKYKKLKLKPLTNLKRHLTKF